MTQGRAILGVAGLLALLVALPLALREDTTQLPAGGARRLVILTPHGESIRREFAEAFARDWQARKGEAVYVDWRSPGGTSEIRMVLDAGYKAAEEEGRAGVGIDLLFGGGAPDFEAQDKLGRLQRLRALDERPEWFTPGGPIPATFTGERYVAEKGTWVATCVSLFGICHNPGRWNALGLPEPRGWRDLTHPSLRGGLALADPTKSGSVARAFELLVQAEMQAALADPALAHLPERERLARGWAEGLRLIQRLAANARYFTDNAGKIPQDVALGNAVAGMCIDFYGRTYADTANRSGDRLAWRAAEGGTTVSGDPIAVLRGAPEPELAHAFVAFTLSPEGQRLWHAEPGTPGGPRWRVLHRPPVRRDAYVGDLGPAARDNPYAMGSALTYRPELTAAAFGSLRRMVRVLCIDTHEELVAAWEEVVAAGLPADAMAAMADVSTLPYRDGGKGDPALDSRDPLVVAARMRELADGFRANDRRAAELARARRAQR